MTSWMGYLLWIQYDIQMKQFYSIALDRFKRAAHHTFENLFSYCKLPVSYNGHDWYLPSPWFNIIHATNHTSAANRWWMISAVFKRAYCFQIYWVFVYNSRFHYCAFETRWMLGIQKVILLAPLLFQSPRKRYRKWREGIDRPSVRPSIRPSVRHAVVVSAHFRSVCVCGGWCQI